MYKVKYDSIISTTTYILTICKLHDTSNRTILKQWAKTRGVWRCAHRKESDWRISMSIKKSALWLDGLIYGVGWGPKLSIRLFRWRAKKAFLFKYLEIHYVLNALNFIHLNNPKTRYLLHNNFFTIAIFVALVQFCSLHSLITAMTKNLTSYGLRRWIKLEKCIKFKIPPDGSVQGDKIARSSQVKSFLLCHILFCEQSQQFYAHLHKCLQPNAIMDTFKVVCILFLSTKVTEIIQINKSK